MTLPKLTSVRWPAAAVAQFEEKDVEARKENQPERALNSVATELKPSSAERLKSRLVRGSRLLVVGDSHVELLRYGLRTAGATSGVTVDDVFKRGSRLDQWAPAGELWPMLEAKLQKADSRPTHVLVELGTNDVLKRVKEAEAISHALALIQAIRAAGATPVVALPLRLTPEDEPFAERLRVALRKALAKDDVLVIDAPTKAQVPLANDAHSHAQGYRTWSATMWNSLTEEPMAPTDPAHPVRQAPPARRAQKPPTR